MWYRSETVPGFLLRLVGPVIEGPVAYLTAATVPPQHCLGLRDAVMSSITVRPSLLNIASASEMLLCPR
ncbi:hypothetical protein FOZ63_018332 [Perkinsus olseni]|uniref:Uncharacterized protein n=1 Tax=Perkinsus olseni TaxID=32597 RepID=A0A7J6SFU8_PEROL|nr:hypothetical protein FOZ63_018332 [Perkinsus olseni]